MALIYPDPKEIPAAPSSIPTPLPPSPASSIFNRIYQSISRAFASLIDFLSTFLPCRSFFADRKVTPTSTTLPPPLDTRDIIHKTPVPIAHSQPAPETTSWPSQTTEKVNPPPAYIAFDESLENLRQTIRELVQLTVDVIHEQQIVPYIATAQEVAPSIPPAVKSITKLLIEMGDKAAKPLFQKLASQKAQTIDAPLKKVLNLLLRIDTDEFRILLSDHLQAEIAKASLSPGQPEQDAVKLIVNWMCSPEQQKLPISDLFKSHEAANGILTNKLCAQAQEFYHAYQHAHIASLHSRLKQRLAAELKEAHIPHEQDLSQHYILPILDWLLLSDQSEPIASMFAPAGRYDNELIDKTFELAISSIVEDKIDQYTIHLDDMLQHHLQEIVYNTIQTNAQTLTDFLSERVAELTSSVAFPEAFDSIVQEVLADHIAACVEAEEAAAKSTAPQEDYIKTFSKHRACNPYTQEIIQRQTLHTVYAKDPANAGKAIEKAFFTNLTEKLLALLLPARKKLTDEGDIVDVDAFSELWLRLSFPEEFYSLSHKVEAIAREFITADTASLFSNVKQPTLEIFKNIFKTVAEDIFKRQFAAVLQNAFEKLTQPEEVDALMANAILPAVTHELLNHLINDELGRNASQLIPHFHAWLNDASGSQEPYLEAIQDTLIPLMRLHFHEFSEHNFHIAETTEEGASSLTFTHLSQEDWRKLTQGPIEEKKRALAESVRTDPRFSTAAPTAAELLALYTTHTPKLSTPPNPIYGEMLFNLICKLGGWNGKSIELALGWIIGPISAQISEALEDVRTFHHFLANVLAAAIKDHLGDKEKLSHLLYAPAAPASMHTKEKLDHQIDLISRLAYDLIIGDANAVKKFAIRKGIGSDATHLNKLITAIYQKCLRRRLINQNLLMQFCEKIFHHMHGAAEAIKHKQNMELHVERQHI